MVGNNQDHFYLQNFQKLSDMNGTKILLFPTIFSYLQLMLEIRLMHNYFHRVCFYTPELRVHNTVHTKQCMNANGISKIATYLFENILCCHFFFFCVCDILRLHARLMKKRPSFRKTKIRKSIYISCFFQRESIFEID